MVLDNPGGQGHHSVLTGEQSQRDEDGTDAREEEGQGHMQGTRCLSKLEKTGNVLPRASGHISDSTLQTVM